MQRSGKNKVWGLITVLLIAVIATGAVAVNANFPRNEPIEITIPASLEVTGQVYIGGAVSRPGFYPLQSGDSVETLLQAAGGSTGAGSLKLEVANNETGSPQKMNINRAQTWLLEALPGIGTTLAQRIVDYREQNGPFRNTSDLLNVKGIGNDVYEALKNIITVAD